MVTLKIGSANEDNSSLSGKYEEGPRVKLLYGKLSFPHLLKNSYFGFVNCISDFLRTIFLSPVDE
jgi:hypothetical protein